MTLDKKYLLGKTINQNEVEVKKTKSTEALGG